MFKTIDSVSLESISHNTKNNFSASSSTCEENDNYSDELEYRFNLLESSFTKISDLEPLTSRNDLVHKWDILSKKAKHLYHLLNDWKYLTCYPSQSKLAKLMKISREWVNKLLKELTRIGLISKLYRHRKTCIYTVPKMFKNFKYHLEKILLIKDEDNSLNTNDKRTKFTPKFTPFKKYKKNNSLSSAKANKSGLKNDEFHKKRSQAPPAYPPWLPNPREFSQKHPQLWNSIKKDPSKWWNICAFDERTFNKAVESVENALQKGVKFTKGIYNYFFASMGSMIPREKQNWKLVGQIKRHKGISF